MAAGKHKRELGGSDDGEAETGRAPVEIPAGYVDQAFKFCLLGATDADLGQFFDVDERTINNWKESHPEFLQSLKAGKEQADARVAQSLYRKALGWEHDAVKIVADAKTGTEHIVPYTDWGTHTCTLRTIGLVARGVRRSGRAVDAAARDRGPL